MPSRVSLLPSLFPLRLSLCVFKPSLKWVLSSFPPSSDRPDPHGRGGGSQSGHADSPLPEQEEEILGSDDDEQEDPNDYCKGITPL